MNHVDVEANDLIMPMNRICERDRNYVCHPWSPISEDRSQLMLSYGENSRVKDIYGNEFIDASSLNTTCGYADSRLVNTIKEQLAKLQGIDISTASNLLVGTLAERLSKYLPKCLSRTLFVNSGSEGIEAAIFIAASYWIQIGEPRSRIVTFERGYHGATLLCRSLSGLPRVKHPLSIKLPVSQVRFEVAPRQLREPESLQTLLHAFKKEMMQDKNDYPIAVLVEPFINVGGGIVLPKGFLSALQKLCKKTGTLLILDEIFTGFGRSGKMFAFEYESVIPDILVSSKGLASGYMPICAVTFKDEIYRTFANDKSIGGVRYGHTTSGHAGACAAALATLDIIDKDELVQKASYFGSVLMDAFSDRIGVGHVVDVRNFGLVLVIEMSSFEIASRLIKHARSEGVLLRQQGEALMVVPPLTIDEKTLNLLIKRLQSALARIQ
ncbi:MAG: aspartate aminotransferase family protein [Pseudomonadota bacterium]